MKEKQFLFTTQIYLFLALGKDSLILIYGCSASSLKRVPTLTSHHNKAAGETFSTQQQYILHFHFKVPHEYS